MKTLKEEEPKGEPQPPEVKKMNIAPAPSENEKLAKEDRQPWKIFKRKYMLAVYMCKGKIFYNF